MRAKQPGSYCTYRSARCIVFFFIVTDTSIIYVQVKALYPTPLSKLHCKKDNISLNHFREFSLCHPVHKHLATVSRTANIFGNTTNWKTRTVNPRGAIHRSATYSVEAGRRPFQLRKQHWGNTGGLSIAAIAGYWSASSIEPQLRPMQISYHPTFFPSMYPIYPISYPRFPIIFLHVY